MAKAGLLFLLVLALGVGLGSRQRWGRIRNESSLRKPMLSNVNFWRVGGSAYMAGDEIKFAPESQKRYGYVWNKKAVDMTSWSVTVEFRVTGDAPVNTGEGFAFWHVSDPTATGDVYGHSDKFHGIGIFFDSFDSDSDGVGEPYVLAMYNDGTKTIDEDDAGIQLGVCFSDYRNLPHTAKARISYTPADGGHLTVSLDITNSGRFKSCISVKDVTLHAESEYFGVTVSDYANNFDLGEIIAVDTSERYDAGVDEMGQHAPDAIIPLESDSEEDSFDDEDGHHHTASFHEHEHFNMVYNLLARLDSELFNVEDEFAKRFASVFGTHNSHFERTIGNDLSKDVEEKYKAVSDVVGNLETKLNNLGQVLNTARTALDQPDMSQRSFSELGELTKSIHTSCVEDTSRGQPMVGQIKDSVAKLKTRQDQVLSNVHADLSELKSRVQDACSGGGISSLVINLVVGVIMGVVVVFLTKPPADKKFY